MSPPNLSACYFSGNSEDTCYVLLPGLGWGYPQMRNFFQLIAHGDIISPHMLLGKTVAVSKATEMHVFLLHAFNVFTLTFREVRIPQLVPRPFVVRLLYV